MNRLERLTMVANQFERELSIKALKAGHNANHEKLRNEMIALHGIGWVEQVEREVVENAGY